MIGDDVILLRPWEPADREQRVALFSDPVVQRFSWPLESPFVAADLREGDAEDEQTFAIADAGRPTRVFGGAGLYDIDARARTAAVGYWLGPAARGRGHATRALGLLCALAFGELGLTRLGLTCAPDNVASRRVAERGGFVLAETIPDHLPFKGGLRDSLRFERSA